MSTIGLDKLYFAEITDGPSGETYGTPFAAPGVQSADLKINSVSTKEYADDGTWVIVNEFVDGTISLGVAELGNVLASRLTGSYIDGAGVLVSTNEDMARPYAVGFRSLRGDHKYEYVWLYRVTFSLPGHTYNTKGESITFSNYSIEGTIERRKAVDAFGKHPWRSFAVESASVLSPTATWFDAVYVPIQGTLNISTQPQNKTVTAGSIDEAITATAISTSPIRWDWFGNTVPNNYGGTPLGVGSVGLTTSLDIPTNLTAGIYYFYAVASQIDRGTQKATNVAKITVEAAS